MKELAPINIHSKMELLSLDSGRYYINIIGIFFVKKKQF